MSKLEEKLEQMIIQQVDVKTAAEKASNILLNDEDFFKKLESRLLEFQAWNDSFVNYIYRKVGDELSKRYIEKYGDKILSEIDPKSVANGMMFKAITGTAAEIRK